MPELTAVGLMSGTSMDGVDVALLETDGEAIVRIGPTAFRPYLPAERELLRRAVADAAAIVDRRERPGALAEAEQMVTVAHAEAVGRLLRSERLAHGSIDVVGFHGQTVLHRPERRLTVQIGDARALAQRIGLRVACDFRAADVAAGGEGAPLAPVYHRALAGTLDRAHPVAVLNIGGVANVTFVDRDAEPIAFDTGPGNAPIDEIVRARTAAVFDEGGRLTAAGRVHQAVVEQVLRDPYYRRPPPKSLDRATFAHLPLDGLVTADAAATAAAIVAGSVALAAEHFPRPPAAWIVAGGGARNAGLMAMLRGQLRAPVLTANDVGWSADSIEAQAFAYLAVRSVKGLPLTYPKTTGVTAPLPGGVIVDP